MTLVGALFGSTHQNSRRINYSDLKRVGRLAEAPMQNQHWQRRQKGQRRDDALPSWSELNVTWQMAVFSEITQHLENCHNV
jgi:hypothetical protein